MLLLFHTAFTPLFGTALLNLTQLVRIRNLAHNPVNPDQSRSWPLPERSEENGADRYLGKAAVGCTGPAGYPVVFTGYQQDDRSQSWCKKRLDRIGHTHRDGEPFRVFVDPDNLNSMVR